MQSCFMASLIALEITQLHSKKVEKQKNGASIITRSCQQKIMNFTKDGGNNLRYGNCSDITSKN